LLRSRFNKYKAESKIAVTPPAVTIIVEDVESPPIMVSSIVVVVVDVVDVVNSLYKVSTVVSK
jgi:hypothetical protein